MLPGTPTLQPAGHRLRERQRLAVGVEEPLRRRAARARSRGRRSSRPRPRASPRTQNPPPPMPELCGSTTVSASIVAIAASVALPPGAQHLGPGLGGARVGGADHALAAAGASAASGAADAGAVAQARAAASGGGERGEEAVQHRGRRYSLPTASAIEAKPSRRISVSSPRTIRRAMPGPFVDHRAVELDQARPGADARPGVLGAGDAADADQRQRAAGRLAEIAQPLLSARSRSGAPDSPPASPAWRERSGGREIVVLETISAPSRLSSAMRAIASMSAGSRSGATLRNTGGPSRPARVQHRVEQRGQRAFVLQRAQARRVGAGDVDRQIGRRAAPSAAPSCA